MGLRDLRFHLSITCLNPVVEARTSAEGDQRRLEEKKSRQGVGLFDGCTRIIVDCPR